MDVIKKKYNKFIKKIEVYLYVLFMWIFFILYLIYVYVNILLIYVLFLCEYVIISIMISYFFERFDMLYFMDDEFFFWNDFYLDRVWDVFLVDLIEFW